MISSVQGTLEARGPDYAVIQVGGVGLQVFMPSPTLGDLGEQGGRVRLHTHLYFKEDTLALYGFATGEELRLFQMLLDVAGMGPRTALNALSVMNPSDMVTAIVSEDADALVRIPGVGRKTAARISLELKGKLEKEWVVAPGVGVGPIDGDALAALMSLGYGQAEARSALAGVAEIESLPLEEKVRQALQRIGQT